MKKAEETFLRSVSPHVIAQVLLNKTGDVIKKHRSGGLEPDRLPGDVSTKRMVKLLEGLSEPNKNRHPAQGIRYGRIKGFVEEHVLDWTADPECTNVTIMFERIRS